MRIKVTAPATTANLGPGFDCLGAALSLGLELNAAPAGSGGGSWTAGGDEPGGGEIGPELVHAAVRAVLGDLPELDLSMTSAIPLARGLGSSAAAVAAGLLLGCALAGREPDPAELLGLGTPLEGHPDNLAPALYGGLCLVVPGHGVMRFRPSPSVRPCIVQPRERLGTAEARGALPETVPLAAAVANIARASGLLALLAGQIEPTAQRLLACTQDLLHQPYRAPLMPRTSEAVERLREAGLAAAVSGAGPSVVCFVLQQDLDRFRHAAAGLDGWTPRELDWALGGARIER